MLKKVSFNDRNRILSEARTKQSEVTTQSKSYPELIDADPSLHLATRHRSSADRNGHEGAAETNGFLPGDVFKFFMVAYLSFRLLCDFIKPYPRIFLGLGGIQWACVVVLLLLFPRYRSLVSPRSHRT